MTTKLDPNDLIRLMNGEDDAARRARRALAQRPAESGPGEAGSPPSDHTLAAYLEGTLADAERAAVDRFLAASPDGRAHLEALADLLHGDAAAPELPADSMAEVMTIAPPAPTRLAASARPGWWRAAARGLTARWLAGGAVAAAAIALAVWHPGLDQSGPPTTRPDFRSANPPPEKCDRNLAIANSSTQPVRALSLRGNSASAWSANLLSDRGLAPGGTAVVTITEGGLFDLRVVLDGGTARERAQVDVCAIRRIVVTPDGIALE